MFYFSKIIKENKKSQAKFLAKKQKAENKVDFHVAVDKTLPRSEWGWGDMYQGSHCHERYSYNNFIFNGEPNSVY